MSDNRLTLIRMLPEKNTAGMQYGFYRCSCGVEKKILISSVKNGLTRSCGCLMRERVRETFTKHGMSRTKEYGIWNAIRNRCLNENSSDYSRYGGRGISMYPEWAGSFEAFYAYVGAVPNDKMQIDRIDNSKGYEPGNVRWADRKTQARNRRSSYCWYIKGQVYQTLDEAAASLGVSPTLVRKWAMGYKENRTGRLYPPKDGCYAVSRYT